MKEQVMYNTHLDGDKIFGIIKGCVMKNWRIKFHDKHDCAMDIWVGMMRDKNGNRRPAKEINSSFINKRTGDRVKDWMMKAYRMKETCKDIPDHSEFIPITDKRDFLDLMDMNSISDKIGREFIEEYFELFDGSVKEVSKKLGLSVAGVDKRRKRLLDSIKEHILNNHPDLYADVKVPGRISRNLGN